MTLNISIKKPIIFLTAQDTHNACDFQDLGFRMVSENDISLYYFHKFPHGTAPPERVFAVTMTMIVAGTFGVRGNPIKECAEKPYTGSDLSGWPTEKVFHSRECISQVLRLHTSMLSSICFTIEGSNFMFGPIRV